MAWEDIIVNGSSGGMEPLIAGMQPTPGLVIGMVFLIITAVVLAILVFALWIWMIIDCAKKKKFENGDNVMWILLLVLTGPIGMILYYFMEVRRGKKGK